MALSFPLNGGGMTSNAFLTDVTVAQDWEAFSIVKSGDLGSGYRYVIKPFGKQVLLPLFPGTIFTLIQALAQGTYVLLNPNGFTCLTAVDGGGLDGLDGGDILHTDAWKPLSWEVFTIVDQGGRHIFHPDVARVLPRRFLGRFFSTDIGTPDTPPPGWITKFEFLMVRTPTHGDILLAIP